MIFLTKHAGVFLFMYKFGVDVFAFLSLLQRVIVKLLDRHVKMVLSDFGQVCLVLKLILVLSHCVQLSLKFGNLLIFKFEQKVQFLELSLSHVEIVRVLGDLNVLHEVV